LFPTRNPEIPVPKASQQAGFSAGPQQRPEGANEASASQLVVPGLLAHGDEKTQPSLIASLESPTSRRSLQAAARSINAVAAPEAASQPTVRLSGAPDPRLEGRIVYAVAIQMPNITSYTGSWIVWFAEREPAPDSLQKHQAHPDIRAPLPLHKVDPKYVPAAVEERIEGKVRLAAIIRKDGHVDTVEIVRSLDERLDRSAGEALAKWEFEPAMRDGVPIDVDAIFEIPFHLAPRVPQ
jgi:TonB family protein